MASKYAKVLQVPTDLPDVLRNFTREILRLQGKMETREAMYEFGVTYFQDLIQKRDGTGGQSAAAGGGASGIVPAYMKVFEDDIKDLFTRVLQDADQQGEGWLDFGTFYKVTRLTCGWSGLELKPLMLPFTDRHWLKSVRSFSSLRRR